MAVSPFLTCNNKDCKKKITSPPGLKIAKCLNCNRSMLIKNCYVDMTVSFNLEKDGKNILNPNLNDKFFSKGVQTYLKKETLGPNKKML